MIKRYIFFILLFKMSLLTFPQGVSNQIKSHAYVVDTFPVIHKMIRMVDTTLILANIQHLQDYGTRNAKKPQAILAQNWIKEYFENYGLSVEIQDFPGGVSSYSDNIIATITGHVFPDEYVILGGHYDSYSYSVMEPGADDNASGTAGVMEVARILSQYEFEKSIVFCAFSAEEWGLVGSGAYAYRAKQLGMNILGYINLDMIGYNKPGELIHTDMICPPNSIVLSDFYKVVSAIYLSDFQIFDAVTIPGESDHISFTENGYMGIFPCEEDKTYSRFIHTSNDLIGLSVNSASKAQKFTQAALASVVSLARPYFHVGYEGKTSQQKQVNLFPNPATDRVIVELNSAGTALLEIFSSSGRKIRSNSICGKLILDLSGFSTGCYLVRITGRDFTLNKKLIIL